MHGVRVDLDSLLVQSKELPLITAEEKLNLFS